MKVGVIAKIRNTLMLSPKANHRQSASSDASTVVQMDILVKTALGHQPNVVNEIGSKEITRRLALNPGRSGQSKTRPLRTREKAKQLE